MEGELAIGSDPSRKRCARDECVGSVTSSFRSVPTEESDSATGPSLVASECAPLRGVWSSSLPLSIGLCRVAHLGMRPGCLPGETSSILVRGVRACRLVAGHPVFSWGARVRLSAGALHLSVSSSWPRTLDSLSRNRGSNPLTDASSLRPSSRRQDTGAPYPRRGFETRRSHFTAFTRPSSRWQDTGAPHPRRGFETLRPYSHSTGSPLGVDLILARSA